MSALLQPCRKAGRRPPTSQPRAERGTSVALGSHTNKHSAATRRNSSRPVTQSHTECERGLPAPPIRIGSQPIFCRTPAMYACGRARKSASLRNDHRFLVLKARWRTTRARDCGMRKIVAPRGGWRSLFAPGPRATLVPRSAQGWLVMGRLARVCAETRAFLIMPRERHLLFCDYSQTSPFGGFQSKTHYRIFRRSARKALSRGVHGYFNRLLVCCEINTL